MDKANQRLLTQALDRMENHLSQAMDAAKTARSLLDGEDQTTTKTPKATVPASEPARPKTPGSSKAGNSSRSVPASDLGETPDINNDDWPEAIPKNMIISDKGEPERKFRALQVVGMIGLPLEGKKVLDCGCGEGFVTEELARQAEHVVGFDVKEDDHWHEKELSNIDYTTSQQTVQDSGPYDVILLYDVIDHLVGTEPGKFMVWVSSLLAKNGIVYVRAHPWTSKHGGHLYEQHNKAYLHLALTPDELLQNGIKPQPNIKVSRPMAAYEKWFTEGGLKVADRKIQAEKPHPFVENNLLPRIVKITWGGNIDPDQARKIIANQFIDYHLSK